MLARYLRWTAASLLLSSFATAEIWPIAARDLYSGVDGRSVEHRLEAVGKLRRLPVERVLPRLKLALSDESIDVRVEAAAVASEFRIGEVGSILSQWLTADAVQLRLAALEYLGRMRKKPVTSSVARLLSDPEPRVRSAACRALALHRSGGAPPALVGRLDDADTGVRLSAIDALGNLRARRAVVPLVGLTQSNEARLREAAAQALGRIGDRDAVAALVLLLEDGEASVRRSALRAIGQLGVADASSAIIALLGRENVPRVRVAAMDALARVGGKRAAQTIVRQLLRSEMSQWEMARLVVALHGSLPEAQGALETCIHSAEGRGISLRCASVLSRLSPKAAAGTIIAASRMGKLPERETLDMLGALGSTEALPHVLERVASANAGIRESALGASLRLLPSGGRDGRIVAPLQKALERATSARERILVLRAFGKSGIPAVADRILPFLDGDTPAVLRRAAAQALGQIRCAKCEEQLVEGLTDADAGVRRAASLALRRGVGRQAARQLLARYFGAKSVDRSLIAFSLGGTRRSGLGAEERLLVERALASARFGRRDSLLEVLIADGPRHDPSRIGAYVTPEREDRAKIAELLEWVEGSRPMLLAMVEDAALSVRANAVWALGGAGTVEDFELLETIWQNDSGAVGGNAVAALARIAARTGVDVSVRLCRALASRIPQFRVNALAGLARSGGNCTRELEEVAVLDDSSAAVRLVAVQLMWSKARSAAPWRHELRMRCAEAEPNGDVAAQCLSKPNTTEQQKLTQEVVVYVVPTGREKPVAGARFALLLPSGFVRVGYADRRGALLLRAKSESKLRLLSPPALMWPQ